MPLSRIEACRKIVAEHQAMKIAIEVDGKQRKVLVDSMTANMVCKVYDALSEKNRATFIALPWPKMVSVGWKLIK